MAARYASALLINQELGLVDMSLKFYETPQLLFVRCHGPGFTLCWFFNYGPCVASGWRHVAYERVAKRS